MGENRKYVICYTIAGCGMEMITKILPESELEEYMTNRNIYVHDLREFL